MCRLLIDSCMLFTPKLFNYAWRLAIFGMPVEVAVQVNFTTDMTMMTLYKITAKTGIQFALNCCCRVSSNRFTFKAKWLYQIRICQTLINNFSFFPILRIETFCHGIVWVWEILRFILCSFIGFCVESYYCKTFDSINRTIKRWV